MPNIWKMQVIIKLDLKNNGQKINELTKIKCSFLHYHNVHILLYFEGSQILGLTRTQKNNVSYLVVFYWNCINTKSPKSEWWKYGLNRPFIAYSHAENDIRATCSVHMQ